MFTCEKCYCILRAAKRRRPLARTATECERARARVHYYCHFAGGAAAAAGGCQACDG